MHSCAQCGAGVSGRDPACSYCGSTNDAYRRIVAEHEALLARGIEAFRGGRHAEAVEHLTSLTVADAEVFDAYFYLAAAWNALRQPRRALDAMLAASRLRPGNAPLRFNLGVLYAHLGQPSEAVAALREAKQIVASSQQPPPGLGARVDAELARLGAA